MSIGLFLMTMKGLVVLDTLIAEFGPDWIRYVIAARDPQLIDDSFDEIRDLCRQNRIAFRERGETLPHSSSYAFAVAWRWLITGIPNLIVLHDSLLPKYRGFAPLPTALIKGDRTIGVTALFAEETYDTGDIIGQKALDISYPIKIEEVIQKISRLYSELLIDICRTLMSGKSLVREKQDESKATYSLWRDETDYRIDWAANSSDIKRFIDSLGHPYSGASSLVNGRLARIYDAEIEPDVAIENRQAGKVIFLRLGYPVIVCGRGLLRITDVRDAVTGESMLPLDRFRSRFSV